MKEDPDHHSLLGARIFHVDTRDLKLSGLLSSLVDCSALCSRLNRELHQYNYIYHTSVPNTMRIISTGCS